MRTLIWIGMRDHNGPTPTGRLAERSVPFTLLGVAVAFALVALPAPEHNYPEIAGAAALGVALIALSLCWKRFPRTVRLAVPLGFLFLAALLRLSDGGAASGFGGLYFLPILWLALSGGRRELLIGLFGLVCVEVIPLITLGAPRYPSADWRPIVIRVCVATIVGFTIQKLLAETRERALEAFRWSQRLESLNEVGNALATETELQPLLDLVAARLRELLGARVVAVLLPAGTGQLRFAAVAGADAAGFLAERIPRVGSRSGSVLSSGTSERADSPPGSPPVDLDLDGRLASRTSLWVPLLVRDRPIGVIAAHDKVAWPDLHFSDDDLRLAETFASRAAVAVDLSERVARDAVRRVVSAQEAERRRLARELHDETGQTLTSVMLGLKSVEEHLEDEAVRAAVAALGRQVASTMQDVRRIALELRPKVLDDFGLVSALERLTTTFTAQTGIAVDLEAQLGGERLPSEIETALYRIVQEGLTNMLKHADPTRASVLVTPKNGRVLLVLEDDGNGFDPLEERTDGLGLEGMRERVELLEGRLTIESSTGTGTTLFVEVPVR
ncbi:MAG TPA: GAF domain-containing sensor histidine kinase [Gaiellaceae bacterium]